MEQRIAAFDIGDRRIGVAVSDPFNSYAMPCDTYFRTGNLREDAQNIARIASELGVGRIVCGLPLNADGTRSVQTDKTERFLQALRAATALPVVTEDERYTTREARRDLVSVGVSTKSDKRKQVDSIAAAYILESYLASHSARETPTSYAIKKGDMTMSMKEERNDYLDEDNIVELVDEDGTSHRFQHVATIEYKGEWYCFFTPEITEESEDEDEAEIAVFRLVGEEDDERLETIEDDALLDEVFAEFCNQYEDSEDADEALSLDGAEEDI